ncbi:MAG: hypothetical protein LN417_05935 [Candidatus Thermoplasmatota archaeon]|nr:hypothetical protein [Candidatus Thermoplasmatota archaeon]
MSNGFWNVRRVRVDGKVKVREVHYDTEGRPWAYADVSLWVKVGCVRDWLRTSVLRYPEDFRGEPVEDSG